jgi:hypothetical protein
VTRDAGPAYRRIVLTVCGVLLLGGSVVEAQVVGVGYAASISGGQGTYPTANMNGVYFFNGVDVTAGPVRAAFTVPWMRVNTTFVATDTTVPAVSSTSTGFGDPLLRLDARVVDSGSTAVGVAGAVKIPMVDASTGRSTGKTDVAVGGTAFTVVERTSLMADVLFWKYGDPEGVDFKDTWSYNVGAAQAVGTGRWSVTGSVSGFSAGIDNASPPVTLNLGILGLVARRQSMAVTASFGLTQSAADFFIATSWRIAR